MQRFMYASVPYHCRTTLQTLSNWRRMRHTFTGRPFGGGLGMPQPNFCPACGEALSLLPDGQRARVWARMTGRCCAVCGCRTGGFQWKTFGLGIGFGLALGVGHTVWQAVQPPPPLPLLTTTQAFGSNRLEAPKAPTEPDRALISRERHRCGALTKKGTPCQRWVSGPTGYCWQHRKD